MPEFLRTAVGVKPKVGLHSICTFADCPGDGLQRVRHVRNVIKLLRGHGGGRLPIDVCISGQRIRATIAGDTVVRITLEKAVKK